MACSCTKIIRKLCHFLGKELKAGMNLHLGKINAEHLNQAHRLIETGQVKGKIVLEGF